MLSPTEKSWDNSTLEFDTSKYKFKEWAISSIQELEPSVSKLETLHLHVEPERLSQIKSHFYKSTLKYDFMKLIDNFMEDYIPEIIENKSI